MHCNAFTNATVLVYLYSVCRVLKNTFQKPHSVVTAQLSICDTENITTEF